MANKKAFVFDTNFIIQNKQLDEVYANLQDEFVVYVTQVSIDERIGQQCRDGKKKFDKVAQLQKEYRGIADITIKSTYEQYATNLRKGVQKTYDKVFGKNIIPFKKDSSTFSTILERANNKIPPFIESTSDKGFKDALIWLSLIEYFKDNGESEIVFVTNDNGFNENIDFLAKEFSENTGKKIEFRTNAYYKELLTPKEESPKPIPAKLPDVSELRDKIDTVLTDLRLVEDVDFYGNEYWNKTFELSKKVDAAYMECIFANLQNDIERHLFDKSVWACQIFGLDDRMTDGESKVAMETLEKALKLYEEIKATYPNYLPQFYVTAANIFNENYSPKFNFDDDSDIPF